MTRWETLEALCDQTLIDGLPPKVREFLETQTRRGVPKRRLLRLIERQGGKRRRSFFWLACEAVIDRTVEEMRRGAR